MIPKNHEPVARFDAPGYDLPLPATITVLTGDAGTGTATSLNAARACYEAAGYRVIGVAPIGKAAVELKRSLEIEEALTLDSMLIRVKNGKLTLAKDDLVIVDEAGRMGPRQADELCEVIVASGAKLLLVGDDKQTSVGSDCSAIGSVVSRLKSHTRIKP